LPEIKDLPESYKQIISLLGYGKDNARTVSYISKLVGLPSTTVREMVSELVTKYELPIGTSNTPGNSGYYFISNEAEKKETLNNLRSRAIKILKRAKAIENMVDPKQIQLF
jgi:hypothetical protein